jgi:hypothetical protein
MAAAGSNSDCRIKADDINWFVGCGHGAVTKLAK